MEEKRIGIGKRLRQTRKECRKTQEDIAEILGVKRQAYSAYERNRSLPDAKALIKLADTFGTSVDYLIGRTDDPKDYKDYDNPKPVLTPPGYDQLTPDGRLRVEGYVQALFELTMEQEAGRGPLLYRTEIVETIEEGDEDASAASESDASEEE